MDYVYDIALNFNEDYYEFYEWEKKDKIINIKKIQVYKVSNKNYLNLKYNDVIINNKELLKRGKMFLITNGLEVLAILIDQNGKITKRSSLLLDEAADVLDNKDNLTYLNIIYQKNVHKNKELISRINKEKKKYINSFLSKIDKEKDKYLLKYIYFDIYSEEEENIEIIYMKLNDLIKNNISIIFDSIKRVSIELKK